MTCKTGLSSMSVIMILIKFNEAGETSLFYIKACTTGLFSISVTLIWMKFLEAGNTSPSIFQGLYNRSVLCVKSTNTTWTLTISLLRPVTPVCHFIARLVEQVCNPKFWEKSFTYNSIRLVTPDFRPVTPVFFPTISINKHTIIRKFLQTITTSSTQYHLNNYFLPIHQLSSEQTKG